MRVPDIEFPDDGFSFTTTSTEDWITYVIDRGYYIYDNLEEFPPHRYKKRPKLIDEDE